MRTDWIARRLISGGTPRLVTWWVAAGLTTSMSACAFLDKVEKLPGREEAFVAGLNRPPGAKLHNAPASPLQAVPLALDFGEVRATSETQKTVTISSPFDFSVTVIRVTVQGCGFASPETQGGDRPVILPHGQIAVTVSFRPAARQSCSGLLLVEIDSAGGRFTRVPLKGRGV
jgi:hypothetical protein